MAVDRLPSLAARVLRSQFGDAPTPIAAARGARATIDEHVFAAAREDGGRALEIMYRGYKDRIYTFLLRVTASAELADDLTHDTFIKASRALRSLDDGRALLPWLYRIANNTAIDHLRRRRRFAFLPWISVRGTTDEPVERDSSEAASLRSDITQVMRTLPPDNAAALLLHAIEGYSYEEIARIQGCSMAAARSRIARARAVFKERYPGP